MENVWVLDLDGFDLFAIDWVTHKYVIYPYYQNYVSDVLS